MKKCFLKLDNVSFAYGIGNKIFSRKKKEVLKEISFSIYNGESIGIIGRNGAGKSTLLRLLADVMTPDSGKITKYCNKISLLSIELGFSDRVSGVQNIILSGLYNGFSKKKILEKMEMIIEFSGLRDVINDNLLTYSTGMRARLGFSIAHHLNPDILLIDEVLGVGDIDFQTKSEKILRERIKSEQTVILVTHDPHLVKEVCSRVIWIENGSIVAQGNTEDIIAKYMKYMLND